VAVVFECAGVRVKPPLIAHVVHRFDFGGLENGLVNLVNEMRPELARHVVISMTDATEIANRICRTDVAVYCIGKRPGKDPAAYVRLFGLLRRLEPDVLHTRNIGTLDCQIAGWLAGIRLRIHGEHGWDTHDPQGTNRKYRVIRRAVAPFVHRFVALSAELEQWLTDAIGIPRGKIVRICNGVDTVRFAPVDDRSGRGSRPFVVGSVTRFSDIKDPLNLVEAYILLRRRGFDGLGLQMIGDGHLRATALKRLEDAGYADECRLPGAELDVAPALRRFDAFVLGSAREGISNTVLEAMASGLPVIATNTGGNPELVDDGRTGFLVEPRCPGAIAEALAKYLTDPELCLAHGRAARIRAEDRFSLAGMVAQYSKLYVDLTTKIGRG
jgi:sugar transferase (PEP-CTERM/EpsH1 system associated)